MTVVVEVADDRNVNFGEDRADTRRQQVRSTLRAAGDDVAEFTGVLETVIAHRLVTIDDHDVGDPSSDPCVDLAHEVMITARPTLAGWVHAHSGDEPRRRELDAKAALWIKYAAGTAVCSTRAILARPSRGSARHRRVRSAQAPRWRR